MKTGEVGARARGRAGKERRGAACGGKNGEGSKGSRHVGWAALGWFCGLKNRRMGNQQSMSAKIIFRESRISVQMGGEKGLSFKFKMFSFSRRSARAAYIPRGLRNGHSDHSLRGRDPAFHRPSLKQNISECDGDFSAKYARS